MCAGMGGVSYHQVVAAVSDAGGFGCLGASTMSATEMVDEIRAVRARTDKPFGVDLLTALPDRLARRRRHADPRGRVGVRRRARRAPRRHRDVPRPWRPRGEHVRQGAPRARGGRRRMRPRDRAGHRSGRSHRHRRDDAARPAGGRRRGRRASQSSPPGGIVDGRGLAAALVLGADGVWVGTRFIATPEARSAPGYKDALLRTAEDGTAVTRVVQRQAHAYRPQRVDRVPRRAPRRDPPLPRAARGRGASGRVAPRRRRHRRPASTPTASAIPRVRASAGSRSSSRRASSCAASSRKRSRRCAPSMPVDRR